MEKLNLLMILPGQPTQPIDIQSIQDKVASAQKNDPGMQHIRRHLAAGEPLCFTQDETGTLWFKQRLVVPKNDELRKLILDEAHLSHLTLHPRTNKNVSRFEATILVDPYEAGDCQICV